MTPVILVLFGFYSYYHKPGVTHVRLGSVVFAYVFFIIYIGYIWFLSITIISIVDPWLLKKF